GAEELNGCDDLKPVEQLWPDNLLYINYTSGSTGRPKGVGIPHRGVSRLLFGANYAQFGAAKVFLHVASIAFDASTFEIWGALLHGGRLVLYPGDVPTGSKLSHLIQEEGVQVMFLTAALFNTLVDESPEIFRGVEQLLVGGEALSPSHVQRVMKALPETR